jgi:large subunit ribosomal protein L5
MTKAQKSIAGFKIREGMPLGIYVTSRREKMYAFLEKFIKLVLPRITQFSWFKPNIILISMEIIILEFQNN